MLPTIPNDAVYTVGVTPVDLSPEKGDGMRTLLIVTNLSSGGQVVYIAVGKDASTSDAIALQPFGVYQETLDARFTPTSKRISAVSNLAGATVAIHERGV